jgi:hypothetical protein
MRMGVGLMDGDGGGVGMVKIMRQNSKKKQQLLLLADD